jgi:hypothetical protein
LCDLLLVVLLEDEWPVWDEVEPVFLAGADFSEAVAVESSRGLAAAVSAQLSVSAQMAPRCALRNFAPGRIMPFTLLQNKSPAVMEPALSSSLIFRDSTSSGWASNRY